MKELFRNEKLLQSITAVILSAGAFTAQYFNLETLTALLFVAAAVAAGYRIAATAVSSLRHRSLGIPALVTVAAIGAIIIGEYWEAAAVTFLFTLGSYLEERTLLRTRNALKSLLDMSPRTARVRREDKEMEIPPREVVPGEEVIVRPGEQIPVDGIVSRGSASVNQAPLTGESQLIFKEQGMEVLAGTIIAEGYLELKATQTGEDTTFARLVNLVEEAQEEKAPIQRTIEKFGNYYTPAIMVLAAAYYLFTRNLPTTLTLLVVACPGALVIGPPVSVAAGIGSASRYGVLLKGGEHLERAGSINILALDKTGTITFGEPRVAAVKAAPGISRQELLDSAAAAEALSEHPLAQALRLEGENVVTPEDFTPLPGKGLKATVMGKEVIVGSLRLHQELGIEGNGNLLTFIEEQEQMGRTVVVVSGEGKMMGAIALSDRLRPAVKETLNRIRSLGVKSIVMLTGDNPRTASEVAAQAGIDRIHASLLPHQKVEQLRRLKQEGIVAMLGDGVNDAPSLAAADSGIAMGGAGSDVAVEAADIVLVSDDLTRLPFALELSRATRANIRQNIVFSVLVALLLIVGVLGQKVFLAAGMLIHQASVLLVILNASRLLSFHPRSYL